MSQTKVVLLLPLPLPAVARGVPCSIRELWMEALGTVVADEINEEEPWTEE